MSRDRQRIDIDPSDFTTLINQKGYTLEHEKAVMCSCYGVDGLPQADCAICSGYGYRYFSVGEIKAVMTGITKDMDIESYGIMPSGTVSITTLPQVRMSFRDRMILKDGRVVYSESKYDSFTQIVETRYPIIEADIVADLNKTYTFNVDYIIENQKLKWLDEDNIPNRFSIRYITYPRFLIMNFPNLIRGTQLKFKTIDIRHVELPVRAIAKLEFLVKQEEL